MNLQKLYDIEPWEWPEGSAELIFTTLNDCNSDLSTRLMAAEMAGDYVVANDKLAQALLDILNNNTEDTKLRSQAAISLGPALEHADIYEFDDPEDIVLSEEVFQMILASLQRAYHDAEIPNDVRRSVLEAAIRAPQAWQEGAVRAAYQSDDKQWQLTAVFCMSYIGGFKPQILEALESGNPDIHYQAVLAAGHQEIEEAWPHIKTLLMSTKIEKPLIFAAIEAAVVFGTPEAMNSLEKLLDANDDEIVDAIHEAMAMLEALESEEVEEAEE